MPAVTFWEVGFGRGMKLLCSYLWGEGVGGGEDGVHQNANVRGVEPRQCEHSHKDVFLLLFMCKLGKITFTVVFCLV